jgi:hypothetical protein
MAFSMRLGGASTTRRLHSLRNFTSSSGWHTFPDGTTGDQCEAIDHPAGPPAGVARPAIGSRGDVSKTGAKEPREGDIGSYDMEDVDDDDCCGRGHDLGHGAVHEARKVGLVGRREADRIHEAEQRAQSERCERSALTAEALAGRASP